MQISVSESNFLKNIFYQVVEHYFSTNAMYDELLNSIKYENGNLPVEFDNLDAWEWAREEFTVFEME